MIRRAVSIAAVALVAGLASPGAARAAWPVAVDDEERPTLAPLMERVTAAVVSVSVVGRASGQPQNPLLESPFFRRFFDLPEDAERPPRRGVGSGVIVDADEGLILTNHHVVADAQAISVVLSDRRELEAEVIGSDPGTDVALLRVDADGLTEIPFGDSDTLRVGDFVVAIGNPFGLGQTATTGIVSALGRSGVNVEGYEDFIQTDASINPGNSGGALIDLDGALVGINTAIISPAGGNVGIGFAIPSDMAREVMSQLLEYGEVRRGRLGIYIQDVTPALADALGLDVERGAIVTDVAEGSPAMSAGLASGDVIVAVDGEPVASALELRNSIGLVRLSEEVELTVVRDGDRRTISARVGPAPQAAQRARGTAPAELESLEGAAVRNLPPEHPLAGDVDGVLVVDVEAGSEAAASGLRPEDVIVAVNRAAVSSVSELTAALEDSPSATALTVLREGRRIFVVLG